MKQGATTIWERWDGQKPDGTFQDVGMNSFNHYAYGAIGDWMYRVMAGIEIDEAAPGYKHILIQPRPGGGFTDVKASHQTPYGKVALGLDAQGRHASSWRWRSPPTRGPRCGCPKAQLAGVTEGGQPLAGGNGVSGPKQDGDAVVVEVGSGVVSVRLPQPGLMTRTWPLVAAWWCLSAALVSAPAPTAADRDVVDVVGLTVDAMAEPLGIDNPKPRLAWRLESAAARRPADGLPCACGLAARMDSPGHGRTSGIPGTCAPPIHSRCTTGVP